MESRPAAGLGRGDERSQQLPLGIGQVGRIAAAGEITGGFLIVDDWTGADHTGFSDTL
jgi:hypothetical protein